MFTRKVLMFISISLFLITTLITSTLLFAGGSAHSASQRLLTKKDNSTILYDDVINTSGITSSGSQFKYSDGLNDNDVNNNDISAGGMTDDTLSLDEIQNSIPSDDGQWIDVNQDQIDPEAVSGDNDNVDNDIYVNVIWRPVNVEPDWNPYTNGYWEYTDDGCSWVSNYSWGTTYHYGRWWYSNRWGWVWSPGRHRSNSWVSWRECDGYAGWYPISPRWHFNSKTNCYTASNGYVSNHWLFVPRTDLTNTLITKKLAVDNTMNPKLFKKSKPVDKIYTDNNKVVNLGPAPLKNEKITGIKIKNNNIDVTKKTGVNNNTKTIDNVAKTNETKNNAVKTGINKTDNSRVNITKTKNTSADNTKIKQTKNNIKENNTGTNKVTNTVVKTGNADKTKVNTTKVSEPRANKQKSDNQTGIKINNTNTEKTTVKKNSSQEYIPVKTEKVNQNRITTKTEQPKNNYNNEVKTEPVKKNYNTEKQTTEKPVIKNEIKQNNTVKPDIDKTKISGNRDNKENSK